MNIFRRLSEPSTHAGIAALGVAVAPLVGAALHLDASAVQGVLTAVLGLFGSLAVVLPEKGASQ